MNDDLRWANSSEMPREATKRPIPGDVLLNAVSQLLVATRRHQTRSDRLYANELASQIIDAMDAETKVKAADLVSRMAEAPEEMQRQLAFSSLEAANIILMSRHTSDAVLMEATSKDIAFRRIIAQRSTLTEPVANRLLFHEETEIEHIILPRAEIQLSKNRLKRLVNRASNRHGLAALLAKRTDLTPRLSLRLFWYLDADGRRLILDRFQTDPSFAADVFTKLLGTETTGYGDSPLANLAKLLTRASTFQKQPRQKKSRSSYEDIVIAMRTECTRLTAEKAAGEGLVSPGMALRIMRDRGGEPLTIFAAALNLSEKSFEKVLNARPDRREGLGAFSGKDKKRLERLYETTNAASAAAILSYWDIDFTNEKKDRAGEKLEVDMAAIKERLEAAYDADNEDPVLPDEIEDAGVADDDDDDTYTAVPFKS
ncbi:MAG: DUF2336 domain-containing protein [Pseudomonadota bacterium]